MSHARLEEVARAPGVAESLGAGLGVEQRVELGLGLRRHPVRRLLRHRLEDGDELVGRVVREVDGLREARPQAGVRRDEILHLLRIAGGDDDEVVAVVLEVLHQRVDGFLAEVPLVAAGQRVRLVDQQHTAEGLAHDLLDLDRRLADVARDHPRPIGLDEVTLLRHAEGPIDLREEPRHRRLAGPRVAGEHQVMAGVGDREPAVLAQVLHLDQVGHELDLGLHRREPDERVELGQQLVQWTRRRQLLHGCSAGGRRGRRVG